MVCDFIMQKYTIISHTSITEIRSFFIALTLPHILLWFIALPLPSNGSIVSSPPYEIGYSLLLLSPKV